ncbi:Alpha-amylase A type-1/2 [Chytridiales sp. JEL 0842]|nr:Alpha-amylase A type-1/2 [Chytridiales sp. JEL 0842]
MQPKSTFKSLLASLMLLTPYFLLLLTSVDARSTLNTRNVRRTSNSTIDTLSHLYTRQSSNSINVVLNANPPTSKQVQISSYTFTPSTGSISGAIWVRNIAFAKVVQLFYSDPTPVFSPNFVFNASYSSTTPSGYEIWRFSGSSARLGPNSQIYVKYDVSGATYYDGNYFLPSPPPTTTTVPPTIAPTTPPRPSPTRPPIDPNAPILEIPHPYGPQARQQLLVKQYTFTPPTRALSGEIYVLRSASPARVQLFYSNSTGVFAPTNAPFLEAKFLRTGDAGYDIWSFEGVIEGGIGSQFYLRGQFGNTAVFDSNGGEWYNYRILPAQRELPGWLGRSVYHVMTDRFARSGNNNAPCTDWKNYCGGNWEGLRQKLGYIKGMGFDAIWISPIESNTDRGYHGYWAFDFAQLNEKFGTETTLGQMIDAAHDLGIYVMFDIVANHMGPIRSITEYPAPLNKPSNFHSYCEINYFRSPPETQQTYEFCRINPVNPDLNTEDPETINYLYNHVRTVVQKFKPDGLRLDTLRHIRKDFWRGYMEAAGGIFSFGEAANSDTAYVADYQNYVPSLANYPLFTNVVQNSLLRKNSMQSIERQLRENKLYYKNSSILGNFIDNHDQDRVLFVRNDPAILRTSIVLALFTDGIPTIWQGTEQAFKENADTRRPMWAADIPYHTSPPDGYYQYLAIMNRYRRDMGGDEFVYSTHAPLFTTESLHIFQRGPFIVAISNAGGGSVVPPQPFRVPARFSGKTLRNVLIPTDTITPDANGFYTITITNGEPKVYM